MLWLQSAQFLTLNLLCIQFMSCPSSTPPPHHPQLPHTPLPPNKSTELRIPDICTAYRRWSPLCTGHQFFMSLQGMLRSFPTALTSPRDLFKNYSTFPIPEKAESSFSSGGYSIISSIFISFFAAFRMLSH